MCYLITFLLVERVQDRSSLPFLGVLGLFVQLYRDHTFQARRSCGNIFARGRWIATDSRCARNEPHFHPAKVVGTLSMRANASSSPPRCVRDVLDNFFDPVRTFRTSSSSPPARVQDRTALCRSSTHDGKMQDAQHISRCCERHPHCCLVTNVYSSTEIFRGEDSEDSLRSFIRVRQFFKQNSPGVPVT